MEAVDVPMPMIEDHTPEEHIARNNTDTKWNTVPVSPPSSLVSTTATAVVARQVPVERTVQELANKIMMMLETTMERVCTWSERVEAQTSETAERDMMIWKRRLANYEESLKQKSASLSKAKNGQAELRKALEAKDAELAKLRAELEAECRKRTNVNKLRKELREAQANVKSL
jgi:predicted RNase H-like nuclease (RuvC/YqgF family)